MQLVTLRVQPGKLVYPGALGRLQDGLVLDETGTTGQVLTQAAGKQLDILGHVADTLAQVVDIELAHIHAINQQVA